MLEKEIIARIHLHRINEEPFILAVCGAADLGKSFLSKSLGASLSDDGFKSSHLTLDSFLIERTERQKQNISGYQIESYHLDKAINCLKAFKSGEAFTYFPYDHKKGECTWVPVEVTGASLLIFDGLHSMHTKFAPFVDMSIFIYTNDNLLKAIRMEANLVKRGLASDKSEEASETELQNYKAYVEPYKSSSDLTLYLNKRWEYNL